MRHQFLPSALLLLALSCQNAPSRDQVRAALLARDPALDTTTVIERVWADGPPWFSCAEVFSKVDGRADRAAVHDQVGNWRALLAADLMTFRDTAAGPVADPGWCVATPRHGDTLVASGWRATTGNSLPSGGLRRGWQVDVGRQRLHMATAGRKAGGDSASADYVLGIDANANGVALGSNKDSVRMRAWLRRSGGQWSVISTQAR